MQTILFTNQNNDIMKEKRLILKLFALVACILFSKSAVAQEAYAEYISADSTLTFYFDDLRSTRQGTTYDIGIFPSWYTTGISESVAQSISMPALETLLILP